MSVTQPTHEKEEDIDGTVLDDVDGIPLEELDGTPLDAESGHKDKTTDDKEDDDINGVPLKSIVPYGDDIDGEPRTYLCHSLTPLLIPSSTQSSIPLGYGPMWCSRPL